MSQVADIHRSLIWMRGQQGLTMTRLAKEEARALFAIADTPEAVIQAIRDAVTKLPTKQRRAARVALGIARAEKGHEDDRPFLEVRRRLAKHPKSTWLPIENEAFERIAKELTGDWASPLDPELLTIGTIDAAHAIAEAAAEMTQEDAAQAVASLAGEVTRLAHLQLELTRNVRALRVEVSDEIRRSGWTTYITSALTGAVGMIASDLNSLRRRVSKGTLEFIEVMQRDSRRSMGVRELQWASMTNVWEGVQPLDEVLGEATPEGPTWPWRSRHGSSAAEIWVGDESNDPYIPEGWDPWEDDDV